MIDRDEVSMCVPCAMNDRVDSTVCVPCCVKVYLGSSGEGHQDGEGGEMVARAGCVCFVQFQQPAAVL